MGIIISLVTLTAHEFEKKCEIEKSNVAECGATISSHKKLTTVDETIMGSTELEKVYNDALTRHLTYLCENMDSTELIPHLMSKEMITNREAEMVQVKTTTYEKNFTLIAMVKKKGPDAIRVFRESLMATKQRHVAERIPQCYEKQINIPILVSRKTRDSLKELYLEIFKKVNPFSLPFTFDIENTWVSLALREDNEQSRITEDHMELLRRAFSKAKMLIIEGKPATGKTSLMRRLAYEWAQQRPQQIIHFDLVLYAEFRDVREQKFKTIVELMRSCLATYLDQKDCDELVHYLTDKEYCKNHRVVLLLDGYDESSLKEQCEELHNYLTSEKITKVLQFNVFLSSRPGYLTKHRGQEGRFVFADVLGFTTYEQKQKYIFNHFSTKGKIDSSLEKIEAVHQLLKANRDLDELAETPLFLTFICLVHERIVDGTILELYKNIIWWLLDRYQKAFPHCDVPDLFGFQREADGDKYQVIQNHYLEFPQLHFLSSMALKNLEKSVFKKIDLDEFQVNRICEQVGLIIREEKRDKSFRTTAEFYFPHRTVQEFLAAYCFYHFDKRSKITDNCHSKIFENEFDEHAAMDEVARFLWQFIILNELQINTVRQLDIFEKFTSLVLDLTLFTSFSGVDLKVLNSCFQYCQNVRELQLSNSRNSALCQSIDLSKMTKLKKLFFSSVIWKEISQSQTISSQNIAMESIVLLSRIKKIAIYLNYCTFKSSALFCNTMEYFLNVLTKKSKIDLGDVTVCNGSDGYATSFTVDLGADCFSMFTAMKTSPQVFVDLELNNALRYISSAYWLEIEELTPRKIFCASFDCFSELNRIIFGRIIFPVNTVLSFKNCSKLRTLVFQQCKFDLAVWQSITKEISNSKIEQLTFNIDPFFGEHFPKYFHSLMNCHCLQGLKIESGDLDGLVWKGYEEEFILVLCDLAQVMKGLKEVDLMKIKLLLKHKETLREHCRIKNIALQFNFNAY